MGTKRLKHSSVITRGPHLRAMSIWIGVIVMVEAAGWCLLLCVVYNYTVTITLDTIRLVRINLLPVFQS